ncbi:hemocyte protein-glutamine gamma-glutamyltransferase-like protein [Dinothrombium tinctorium]|uniref:Hemocyte protein-glutamine gamma-glutamyltransferase-like protein n=1 Tax=Dinothrombium tinctorium TaxID=1965070 RepID=A0A3S3QR53_9ACAR|nr:hemocyte protein-glutamine gamma-glutamyltransferase-like protein [Dinothrombium tinctorium]
MYVGYDEIRYKTRHRLIILFNPWSPEDAVYVPSLNRAQLDSYVLEEEGLMFSYNYQDSEPIPWLYNQFKTEVLSAVIFVLEGNNLHPTDYNNPISVTTFLNQMIRDRIIEGNWQSVREAPKRFNGHEATHALSWGGSAEILEEYHQYNGDKIGFAQCWVFAGVLITMLRTLGIPSRPISNFLSATDHEHIFTIDCEYKNGKIDFRNRGNGIWNFHVWVQASMKRRDKGEKFDGWQEVDPTYMIGPIPNQVITDAKITDNVEAFFYAAINSDKVLWNDGIVVETKTDEIGIQLLTTSLNLNDAEDLTTKYKPPEGTEEERRHYKKAADSFGIRPVSIYSRNRRSAKIPFATISLSIESLKPVFVGEPVNFDIHLKNPTFRTQNLNIIVQVDSLYYFGHVAYPIKHNSTIYSVASAGTEKIPFSIGFADYQNKLMSFRTLRIVASTEDSNRKLYFVSKQISLLVPELELKRLKYGVKQIGAPKYPKTYKKEILSKAHLFPSKTLIGNPIAISIKFSKPLNFPLNNVIISIDGKRCKRETFSIGCIEAMDHEEKIFPLKCILPNDSEESLVATLISNEIDGLTGSLFC